MDLIILHTPFAQFRPFNLLDDNTDGDKLFGAKMDNCDRSCQLSRMLCFTHAITLTKIFKQHHASWNARKMSVHAVGHAEIAASTLFSGLIHTQDSKKRDTALKYLKDIAVILEGLALTYGIAQRVSQGLQAAMRCWNHREASKCIPSYSPPLMLAAPSAVCTNTLASNDSGERPYKRPRSTDQRFNYEDTIDTLPLYQQLPLTMSWTQESLSKDELDSVEISPLSRIRPDLSFTQRPTHQQFLRQGEPSMMNISLDENWTTNPTWDTFVDGGTFDEDFSLGDGFDFGTSFDSFRPTVPYTTSHIMPQERTLGADRLVNIELF